MQIVIDIPEEEYEEIIYSEDCGLHTLTRAIANGTPLPKGHGRLIDADEIDHYMLPSEKQDKKTWFTHSEAYRNAVIHFNHAMMLLRDNAPTIIEADKGESEE